MGGSVYRELGRLPGMEASQLRRRYREVFGEEARITQKQQLIRRIGWKLQALAQGDISEGAHRRALQIAQDSEVGIRLPSALVPIGHDTKCSRDPRLPAPGTELRRQYRDRTVVVKVLTDGFEYEGRRYTSLSAVARAATGTRWNGWTFFGCALRESAGSAQNGSDRKGGRGRDLVGGNGDVNADKVTKSRGGTGR
jgi:Protein of unknown function (DUF2924)